jgi:hypothetical protein
MFHQTSLLVLVLFFALTAISQDSISSSQTVSIHYLDRVSSKASQSEEKPDKQSEKALQRFQKQEAKIKRKLAKTDSLKAIAIFGNAADQYKSPENRVKNSPLSNIYNPSPDTLISSLNFLQQNPQLLSQVKESSQKLKEAPGKVNGLQQMFQKAEDIKREYSVWQRSGLVGISKVLSLKTILFNKTKLQPLWDF